jgi:hypothetical protein
MKEHKPLTPESAEPDTPQPESADQKANKMTHKNGVGETSEVRVLRPDLEQQRRTRSDMAMQTDIRRRASRGKLSREALEKLGRVLIDYYDDVRKEGVPDRFKDLLQRFDERQSAGRKNDEPKDTKDKGSN